MIESHSKHTSQGKAVAPWIKRLPNQLTWLRICAIPIVVFLMHQGPVYDPNVPFQVVESDIWAAAVFGLAAITDFLDGWLARKFDVETVLGKLLDPLADKLLVVSALVILVDKHRLEGWIAVLLIVRDLGINAIRLAALEDNIHINSSWLGKTKTAFLGFGIAGLAVNGPLLEVIPMLDIGRFCIYAALFASVWSAIEYLYGYEKEIKK